MIRIIDAGPQTTVQDLGRFGQLKSGIPPSGPMDRYAFRLANRLAGNPDTAAALECTLVGVRFEVEASCAIGVTGADMPVTLNGAAAQRWATIVLQPGDIVKLGAARAGVRSYVAFSGGIDVPEVLGSRSTYLRGKLGGVEGRILRKNDRLRLFPATRVQPWRIARHAIPSYRDEPTVPTASAAPTGTIRTIRTIGTIRTVGTIRVVLGPQADRFTPQGIATFLGSAYTLLPQSDRMGARFVGPRIAHTHGHDIVSDGIALGSVQVPGDGQPIVLMTDRQSTGGYTKLATVCSFDIGRIAQSRPGQSVRFSAITLDEAHRLLRAADAFLESDLREEIP